MKFKIFSKRIHQVILPALLLLVLIVSCHKDLIISSDQPKLTKSLVVPEGFSWKTSKEIKLNIIGLKPVNSAISRTVYIDSPDGIHYYKDLLKMNTDYTIRFAVPSTETKILITYGSKIKTIDLTTDIITFDYLTE